MYREGDSIRIATSIIDAKDGRVVGQLDDVVGASSRITATLHELEQRVGGAVAALADTLYRPWSRAHSRTPTYAAFQEFILGLDGLMNDPQAAIVHLRNAAAADTAFVEAKIWLITQLSANPGENHVLIDSLLAAAAAQRPFLTPFDAAALDRVAAVNRHDTEGTYRAARRLADIAPTTQDAQNFLYEAALKTRRFKQALAALDWLRDSEGWMSGAKSYWLMREVVIYHALGQSRKALTLWRAARLREPSDYGTCIHGVNDLALLGEERQVDSLVVECSHLPNAPTKIPNLGYFSEAIPQYLATGHLAEAHRAAQRVVPFLEKFGRTEPAKRRSLVILDCEFGDWKSAYARFAPDADSASLEDRALLAIIAAHLGDTTTVSTTLRWMDEYSKTFRLPAILDQLRAEIVLAQGDRANALRLMAKVLSEEAIPLFLEWPRQWEFAPLRGDPRFKKLLAPVT